MRPTQGPDSDAWEVSPAQRIRGRVAYAAACLGEIQARDSFGDLHLLERAHDALGEALAIDRDRRRVRIHRSARPGRLQRTPSRRR